MRLRRPLVLLAALMLAGGGALSAAGCGSSAPISIDPVAKAADATSRTGGAQVKLSVSMSGTGLPAPVRMEGTGNFNLASSEGRLDFTIQNLPEAGVGSLTISELVKGGVAYVRSPLLEGKLPNGARWLKIDFASLIKSEGFSASTITSGGIDPTQYLQFLKAHGASVSASGHEPVNGVPTTRYTGSFDIVKASEQMPGANASEVRKALEKVLPSGNREIPISVWVDRHSLVRRMTMDMSLAVNGQSQHMALTMDFTSFGATPTVNPPAGSEVFDVTQKMLAAASAL